MVEIEIGVMVRQCLSRRIAEKSVLIAEIAQWERRRNREGAQIERMFTVDSQPPRQNARDLAPHEHLNELIGASITVRFSDI